MSLDDCKNCICYEYCTEPKCEDREVWELNNKIKKIEKIAQVYAGIKEMDQILGIIQGKENK